MHGISSLTFVIGTALGATLLLLGVLLGGWLSARRRTADERIPTGEVLRLLGKLGDWSQEFVTDASEYHAVVNQMASEIQGTPGNGRFSQLVTHLVSTNNDYGRRLARAEQTLQQHSNQIQVYLSEARTDGKRTQ